MKPTVNLPGVSATFPELETPLIERESLLDLVDRQFEQVPLVFIKGEPGIGKTTLLAQYALRHSERAISLFIRPFNRTDYHPDTVRLELLKQIGMLLRVTALATPVDLDAELRSELYNLRSEAAKGRAPVLFVVDGLGEIQSEHDEYRKYIVDMLPFASRNLRFLFSGDPSICGPLVAQRVSHESIPLPGFTDEETTRFFDGLGVPLDAEAEVRRSCRRIPGRLAVVRRMVSDSGGWDESLLSKMPDQFEALLGLEWEHAPPLDELERDILAVIAFDVRRPTLDQLAEMFDRPGSEIRDLANRLTFVDLDAASGEVSYISGSHQQFARKRLDALRLAATRRMTDSMMRNLDSPATLEHLPEILARAGESKKLLQLLSPEQFDAMVEHSRSIYPVLEKTSLGLTAAMQDESDSQIFRFSLQGALMGDLATAQVWSSEVAAKMALGETEAALALAHSTSLNDDRLHLLAVIARKQKERNGEPDAQVIEEIHALADSMQYPLDSEYAIEIASDLIHTAPDLAVRLVEKATEAEGALGHDVAFTRLSIHALLGPKEDPLRTAVDVQSRIKDPGLRRISESVVRLFRGSAASAFLQEVQRYDSVPEQLFLLRQWTVHNAEQPDAADVVEFGVDLAIRHAEVGLNARVLRELAAPLPYSSDLQKVSYLMGQLDYQNDTVIRTGPTEDYVALQLLLAEAEARIDGKRARQRIEDVTLFVTNLDELGVRTAGLANLMVTLSRLDPDRHMEESDRLHSMVEADFSNSVEKLLNTSAEHFFAIRSSVQQLALHDPEQAMALASRLNTVERRDLALVEVARAVVSHSPSAVNPSAAAKAISKIQDTRLRDQAAVDVIMRLDVLRAKGEILSEAALPVIGQVFQIGRNSARCRACCAALRIIAEDRDDHERLWQDIKGALWSAWEGIDVGWRKVDTGYRIAEALADVSIEDAQRHLAATDAARESTPLSSGSAASPYLATLELATRAFGGLLAKKLDSSGDIVRFQQLLEVIPSRGEQALLWSRIAELFALADRRDDARAIVTSKLRSAIADIPETDTTNRSRVIGECGPALYIAHATTALDEIARLEQPGRDQAYVNICDFILNKRVSTDPYDAPPNAPSTASYEELRDVAEILSCMESDSGIYYIISKIADTVSADRHGARFTRAQRNELFGLVSKIIQTKLPAPGSVQHEGYAIIAEAEAAHIRRESTTNLEELVKRAEAIDNLADRALVLGSLANHFPSR
jgi:hypothetical protein